MTIVSKSVVSAVSLLAFVAVADAPNAHAKSKSGKTTTETTGRRAAQQIITLTNRERRQRGLAPLSVDGRCAAAISGHVNELAKSGYLSHQGADGRGPHERYRKYNPAAQRSGENLAYNTQGTGESFMRQWLNSPSHSTNIFNSNYKGIGVAVRANCSPRGEDGKCYYYAGQCFSG